MREIEEILGIQAVILSQLSPIFALNNPNVLLENPHLHSFFYSWELG